MKTALAILGQLLLLVLFVALFFVASSGLLALLHVTDPFHGLRWFLSHPTPTTTRFFRPSGLILVTLFYLVVLVIEAVAKRLRTAGKWTTVVYILAVVIGLISKFGWITLDPNS